MKSIMISIRPEWVEKILNKEKTIEIRKTMPKCELPCKVYIYCTQSKPYLYRVDDDNNFELTNNLRPQEDSFVKDYNAQNGKVVAEFTLDKADTIEICDPYVFRNKEQEDWMWFKSYACLDAEEMMDYIGYGCNQDGWCMEYDKGYAWHIDNLKIYDKPKELGEFKKWIDIDKLPCSHCQYNSFDWQEYTECCAIDYDGTDCIYKKFTRPPQSWCYVEEMMKSE